MANISTRTVQLIVTEACNLNCIYCYEEQKTNRNMPPAIAKEKLRKFMSIPPESDGFDR